MISFVFYARTETNIIKNWDKQIILPEKLENGKFKTFSFQEYFFKSQESLATVIDFVEEEIDLENVKNPAKGGKVCQSSGNVVNHQSSGNSSTQSSPREPASRRRVPQVTRRLTP